MKKYYTTGNYRVPSGLEGFILQESEAFPEMVMVVLKYGNFDWRVVHINRQDLIQIGEPND